MRRQFSISYWSGLVAAFITGVVSLHFYWNPTVYGVKPLPHISFATKDVFLSYNQGFESDHYLFLYNFFGMGTRLKNADVLLIGTSHTQLGLSAGILSKRLSAAAGHPVHVYNMGLSYEEGWGFVGDVLERNHIENKAVIFDLFNPLLDKSSSFGAQAQKDGALRGFVKLGNNWLGTLERSLCYSYLPCIGLQSNDCPYYFIPQPFIYQLLWRNWADGDIALLWRTNEGVVYGEGADSPHKLSEYPDADIGSAGMLPPMKALLQKQKMRAIATVIPWGGMDLDAAVKIAGYWDYHYIIPPHDFAYNLTTYDKGHHLTSVSRDLVTEQLFRDLMAKNLWPFLSGEEAKTK